MCVCVCMCVYMCVCVNFGSILFINIYLIEHNRHFLSTYFLLILSKYLGNNYSWNIYQPISAEYQYGNSKG